MPKPLRGGELVGIVSGESTPSGYVFTVDPVNIPPLYDYVYVEVEELPPGEETPVTVKVLGQVRGIERYAIGVSPDTPWPVIRGFASRYADTIKARVKILGYRWRGRILYPRSAPSVGSNVYLAPDKLLEEFYSIDERRRLHVGYLISRQNVPAYLDIEGVKRHVAIVAATGAGKTWASVVLIEELLKKGATIVVLDPHGEYVAMKRSACKLGPEFCNSVLVLKGRSDQEGDLQYMVSVSSLNAEELATIAGVPSKATRIRSVIGGGKEVAERLSSALGVEELKGLKWIIRIISAAIDVVEVYRSTSSKSLEGFARQFIQRLVDEMPLKDKRSVRSAIDELAVNDEKFNRGIRRLWLALRKDSEPGYDAIRYLDDLRRLGVYGVKSIPITSILRPGTVVVFNLAGLRQEVQDHLAYNILSRIFSARVSHVRGLGGESYPYPVVVVLEEAHRFMPPKSHKQTRTRDVAAMIASEGRKFGVFMVAITQRPSRIDPDVLSQLQTQIILRIVNPRDQDAIRDASEQVSQDLLENLPGLNVGEAVVVGPMAPAPLMIRLRDRVLDYSGGDIILVDAWTGSLEEARIVEDYRVEALARIRSILSEDFTELSDAVSKLLGVRVDRETVEEALRILARYNVYAEFSLEYMRVLGEASGCDVHVSLSDKVFKCSCCEERVSKPCRHAVAVVLKAVLDGVFRQPVAEAKTRPWFMEDLL